MITDIDEGKGVVRVFWHQIRERVAQADPIFAEIVDTLNPDKSFPLYLAYYPYGEFIGDTEQAFFPKRNGGVFGLNDAKAPQELVEQLGYGSTSQPMGMLLEKELECFVDLKDQHLTIPRSIFRVGSIFPLAKILRKENSRLYSPNGVLVGTSGVRSCFMLPHIGSTEPHAALQRDFNIKSPAPKTLYEHWQVFKEIANSSSIENSWRSCILYFSQKWVDMLHQNKSWQPLKLHMHELAWQRFEYRQAHTSYDIIFSMIQKKRNLKPNPYLADTARHLFDIALGEAAGYAPAHNNNSLPLDAIHQAYMNSYQLKNHPVIFQPLNFKHENNDLPIYYSLQYPSTYAFSPKSQKGASTLVELRDLEHLINVCIEEFSEKNNMCAGTALSSVAEAVKFSYFHNKFDRHKIVQPSHELNQFDSRFKLPINGCTSNNNFPSDAPFVRGCISISTKKPKA